MYTKTKRTKPQKRSGMLNMSNYLYRPMASNRRNLNKHLNKINSFPMHKFVQRGTQYQKNEHNISFPIL